MGKLVTTNVISEVQITKEDLISIAVSEYEQTLLKKEKDLVKKKKVVSDELADTVTCTNTESKAQVTAEGCVGFDAIIQSLKACGYDPELKVTVDSITSEVIKYSIGISEVTKDRYSGSKVNIHKSGTLQSNVKLVALLEKGAKLQGELEEIQEQRLEAKKALSNLGTIERSAKANLARSVLEKSEEGRELLSQIGSLEELSTVKLLGTK